jgi:hypothetical protein
MVAQVLEATMKVLHLINKKRPNSYKREGLSLVEGEPNHYVSCCWDFDLDECRTLIGGMIYLHDTKKDKSFIGGVVKDVQPIDLNIGGKYYQPTSEVRPTRSMRVYIKFESTLEGRNVDWQGMDHSMAWTSGIVDL